MAAVIDTKLLGRGLRDFSGDENDWSDWCYRFESYCGAVSQVMLQSMERAREHENPIVLAAAEDDVKQHSANLAYILKSVVYGEMTKVYRKIEKGNGFEMWRRMCIRYEHKDKNTKRGVLNAVMDFSFAGASLPE
eukprot:8530225-Pyramimonas_sp.AAC.1